jgi:type III secretion protein V
MTEILLLLRLDHSLGAELEEAAIIRAAQTAAQAVCDQLGLPATAHLQVERAELPYGIAELWVDGTRCRHADSLEGQLFSALRGVLHAPSTQAALLAWLAEQPERLPTFLSAFTAAALSSHADLLLTEPVAAAYRDRLPDSFMRYPVPTLRAALLPLLALRVALKDHARVAEILQIADAEFSEALFAALRPQQLAISCSGETLRELTQNAAEDEQAFFDMLREGMFYELGVHYPSFTFAPEDALPLGSFRLHLNNLPSVAWQGLSADQVLVNATTDDLRRHGIPSQPAYNPATGRAVALAHRADATAIRADGFHLWTPFGYLILNISALLRHHSALFVCQSVAARALNQVELAFPALSEVTRQHSTPASFARLLRALLAENVSVRNTRLILESLSAYAYVLVPPDQIAFDERLHVSAPPRHEAGVLAHVRTRLSHQLTHQAARGRGTLEIYLLAPALEQIILQDETRAREVLLKFLRAKIAMLPPDQPPTLLTTADVRSGVRALIGVELPQVRVLAYQELVPEVNLLPVERITLD